MYRTKYFSAVAVALALLLSLGCTSTSTQESTGEYMDNSIVTARVKTAIFKEPSLKSAEINVETFKGAVQLSGFVSSQSDINKAVEIAHAVEGVKSVKNNMQLK
ncbi:MAG: BON domain-containing protein [Gammaproteobacteria bacterium]|nr:BON domain-containing protein [Gammaproteobacteria bacterium]